MQLQPATLERKEAFTFIFVQMELDTALHALIANNLLLKLTSKMHHLHKSNSKLMCLAADLMPAFAFTNRHLRLAESPSEIFRKCIHFGEDGLS